MKGAGVQDCGGVEFRFPDVSIWATFHAGRARDLLKDCPACAGHIVVVGSQA